MGVLAKAQPSLLLCGFWQSGTGTNMHRIELSSLNILFSHFRPRDALMGIFLLFFHELCVNLHVHKTTFERNYSLE